MMSPMINLYHLTPVTMPHQTAIEVENLHKTYGQVIASEAGFLVAILIAGVLISAKTFKWE